MNTPTGNGTTTREEKASVRLVNDRAGFKIDGIAPALTARDAGGHDEGSAAGPGRQGRLPAVQGRALAAVPEITLSATLQA